MSDLRMGRCPSCSRQLRLPATAAGRRVKCSGCASLLRISEGDGDAFRLTPIASASAAEAPEGAAAPEGTAAVGAAPAAMRPCPACGADGWSSDTFCQQCGANISEAAASAARRADNVERTLARQRQRRQRDNQSKVAKASLWLFVLFVVFVAGGTYYGFAEKGRAQRLREGIEAREQARQSIEKMLLDNPDLPAESRRHFDKSIRDLVGPVYDYDALRAEIDFRVLLAFGLNYLLGFIMLALYIWARSAPLPAMLTGMCTYLVVLVADGVLQPENIFRGLLLKCVIVGALLGGVRAAMKQRAGLSQSLRRRPQRR
jgi:hypothetical protein